MNTLTQNRESVNVSVGGQEQQCTDVSVTYYSNGSRRLALLHQTEEQSDVMETVEDVCHSF